MAQTDSEIIQQWDDYIEEYEEKIQEAKQNSDSTLQDGTASNSDRFNSAKDYVAQEQYLQQLKSNRDILQAAYDNGQPLPDVIFNVAGMGGVCQSVSSQLSTVSQASYKSGNNIVIFETDFGAPAYVPATSTDFGNISSISDDDHNYHAEGCKINQNTAQYASFSIVDDKGYFTTISGQTVYMGSNGIKRYTIIQEVDPATFNINQVPVLSRNNVDSIIGYVSGSSAIYFDSQFVVGKGIRYDYGYVVQDPHEDKPWDYYNDNIKDEISNPDNAVFPEGYSPDEPTDPPEEPEIPDNISDEGVTPELNSDTKIIAPSLFITQYVMNANSLRVLGETLWKSWNDSSSYVWENFLFNFYSQTGTFNITAALDYIISLQIYPFDIGGIIDYIGTDFYGVSDGVYMGTGVTNFTYNWGHNIPIINSVVGKIRMGECVVTSDKAYNDFRDMYNSSVLCYLPFCGTIQLNPVDVWGRTLRCTYLIDFQAGACTAIVECEGDTGYFPVGSKSGQIGFKIPINATNAGQLAATFARDVTQAAGTIAGLAFDVTKTALKDYSKLDKARDIADKAVGGELSLIDQGINVLSRSGVDMPMLSGGIGSESILGYLTPFVEIRRGKYGKPENFPHSMGYVNETSQQIKNYKGLCVFTGVDTTGLKCNDAERTEILSLLQTGVYI